jgi:branched-subunit amino acid transport protein
MSIWTGVLLTCAGCYLLKLMGMVLPERALAPLGRFTDAVPVALLAALVGVSTLGDGRGLVVDARLAGVAVGAALVWRRAPVLVVIVGAGATAALLRAIA